MAENLQPHLDRIRSLVPLNSLSDEGFAQAAKQVEIRRYDAREVIFRKGDDDDLTVFLLSGTVELDSGDRVEEVKGGSEKAQYALAGLKPRRYTASAAGKVAVCRIDVATLDKIITWDQMANPPATAGYEIVEMGAEENDSDWMIRTLRTPAFLRLPTANIQSVLAQFEEVAVSAGQVIIREGEEGDYFYLIKHGQCQVSRTPPETGTPVVFDTMEDGDAFGEDALVSDRPRNATITMTSDGVLMRLGKQQFSELMKAPLLKWIDGREAATLLARGVKFLDVRLESEYRNGSIKKSRNLPLFLLRLKADELDDRVPYVVFCDTGARSAAAAFLLTERGFDVKVLRGGLAAVINQS